MIQVLAFAVFIGIAASYVKKDVPVFIELIDNLNKVFNKMVMIIIQLTPVAVFALLAKTFATEGVEVLDNLIKYFLVSPFCLNYTFPFNIFNITETFFKPKYIYVLCKTKSSDSFHI